MKTRVLFLTLLLLSVSAFAIGQTPDKPQSAPPTSQKTESDTSEYRQLTERAKRGDADVDFVRLRDAYALWLCSDAQQESPNRDAAVAAFEAKDNAKFVELVEEVLDYEFVHVGLHRAAEDAYRKLNNQTKADFHKNIAEKLINAMLTSGDGKTEKTAYRVLTISEEYFIMNQLGYNVNMQALLSKDGKAYDLLSGQDKKTKKDVSVFFDISSFFGGCERAKKKPATDH